MIFIDKEKILSMTPHFGKIESNLFTKKEFEVLLNFRPISGQKRFVPCRNHTRYEWNRVAWQTDISSWPHKYMKDVINKTSIYFRECSKINKKINEFSLMLEDLLKKPIDCHIYYSHNAKSENFGKHNDENDNVIVCTEGTQNCEVFGKKKISKVMEPGDYVFIPRKIDHKITPLQDKRISLSFCASENNPNFEDRGWITL